MAVEEIGGTQQLSTVWDRRAFLRCATGGSVALGLFGLGGSLVACGDDDDETRSGSGDGEGGFGTFVHQVNWYAGTGWAGSYLAEEAGVYEDLGFEGGVEILYGGPNVAVEPVVQEGRALIGIANSETFAAAVRQGAALITIGAYYQRNPFCIASLPGNPINTATDLVGKKIGIQPLNENLWAALLDINDIDPSTTETVVVQEDPTPLVNGEVDGFLSFVNGQPITLQLFHEVEPVVMMLADFGFALYQQLYIVTEDSLANDRAAVTAGLEAEIIGKQMQLADPEEARRLTIEKYARDQDIDPQWAELSDERTLSLVITPTTDEHGLMYMTDEDIAANVETLALLDLEVPASAYTHEILDDIYADGVDLI